MRLPNRGAFERHVVFGDRIAAAPDLLDQHQQRAVRGDKIGQCGAAQRRGAGTEKLLGGRVDEADLAAAVEHDDRVGKRRQHRSGFGLAFGDRALRVGAPPPERRLDQAASRKPAAARRTRGSAP